MLRLKGLSWLDRREQQRIDRECQEPGQSHQSGSIFLEECGASVLDLAQDIMARPDRRDPVQQVLRQAGKGLLGRRNGFARSFSAPVMCRPRIRMAPRKEMRPGTPDP